MEISKKVLDHPNRSRINKLSIAQGSVLSEQNETFQTALSQQDTAIRNTITETDTATRNALAQNDSALRAVISQNDTSVRSTITTQLASQNTTLKNGLSRKAIKVTDVNNWGGDDYATVWHKSGTLPNDAFGEALKATDMLRFTICAEYSSNMVVISGIKRSTAATYTWTTRQAMVGYTDTAWNTYLAVRFEINLTAKTWKFSHTGAVVRDILIEVI